MKFSYLILLMMLVSCGKKAEQHQASIDTLHSSTDTAAIESVEPGRDEEAEEGKSEVDCIFNSDYKGLTTEWMEEFGIKDYFWDEPNLQTVVPQGQDTLYFSQGGCGHFGFSIEMKLPTHDHPINDSLYWITQSKALVDKYGFDFYSSAIAKGQVQTEFNKTSTWFSFEDDDVDDNLIYNGIEISETTSGVKISVSMYYN